MQQLPPLAIVIPAAGVGKRMQSALPKQYLTLKDKTVIEHTLAVFQALPYVSKIVIALSEGDEIFSSLPEINLDKVLIVTGGKERADSVLKGINAINEKEVEWVMVHDAARPCVLEKDITKLYLHCLTNDKPGILASLVRDTMKRGNNNKIESIDSTVERANLWHALTPQCSRVIDLKNAIVQQTNNKGLVNDKITDEASALELAGHEVLLMESSVKNIKITMPEDLELAEFYLAGKNK